MKCWCCLKRCEDMCHIKACIDNDEQVDNSLCVERSRTAQHSSNCWISRSFCGANIAALACEADSLGTCWLALVLLGVVYSVTFRQLHLADGWRTAHVPCSEEQQVDPICGTHTQYNYHNSGRCPLFSLLFKTLRFRDGTLLQARRQRLALSIGPNWVCSTWRRRQNLVSEILFLYRRQDDEYCPEFWWLYYSACAKIRGNSA
jgi:hypothetical protein